MARTVEQILIEELGRLVLQNVKLVAALEAAEEKKARGKQSAKNPNEL